MAPPAKKTFWQRLRLLFRWLRIFCWLLLLTVVVGFIYLNRVGLPDFVKNRVVAELHQQGLDVEFQRLRLRWYQGLVAENLSLGRAGQTKGPQLTIDEAEVHLNGDALGKFKIKVDYLQLHEGRLVWPLLATNEPPRLFKLEHISTVLRLQPNDQYELDHFQARSFGIKFTASGVITNASLLRDRLQKFKSTNAPAAKRDPEAGLRRFVSVLDQFKFSSDPEISVAIGGDAAATNSYTAQLNCKAAGATTPWGAWQDFQLALVASQTPGSNSVPQANLKLDIGYAQTQWATGHVAHLDAKWHGAPDNPVGLEADWTLTLTQVATPWGGGSNLHFSAQSIRTTNSPWLQTQLELASGDIRTEWVESSSNLVTARIEHMLTNGVVNTADCRVEMREPTTRWGRAQSVMLSAHLLSNTNATHQADADWGKWKDLEPFPLDLELQVSGLASTNIEIGNFGCVARWRAPDLSLEKVSASLYGGGVNLDAKLNVANRLLWARGGFDFDAQKIKPLLNPASQRWIGQFSWEQPPHVMGEATLTLPAWTNAQPDWRGVQPTVALTGNVQCGPGGFRGIPFDSAHTDLTFSNSMWRLPNLTAHRVEGDVVLDYSSHAVTQDYHWGIRSHVDPNILQPLFETEKDRKAFGYFQLTGPPVIEGDIWGRWHSRELTGFDARVVATNFIFRGEGCSNFVARAQYTNSFLTVTGIRIEQGRQVITAERAEIDLPAQRLYFTNAVTLFDPMIVGRVIGPKTAEAIKPYKFFNPPAVRAYGSLRFQETETTDLHFDVTGGPFNYWKFNLPEITGLVHWVTNRLFLENVRGSFYGGQIQGGAVFDFAPENGTTFNFEAHAREASLHTMMNDLLARSNKLEGIFSADLHVTSALSSDWGSWEGYGNVNMRDGLIWDVPIFGIFSPILNGLASGLGNSRAKELQATYTITNSIIRTGDLEIHSPPARLHYDGTVDFAGNVDARVDATMFRNTLLVGWLLELLQKPFTKVFEYKVTGTLGQPKTEPVYLLPKLVKMPFWPLLKLQEMLTSPGENQPGDKPKPEDKPPEKK